MTTYLKPVVSAQEVSAVIRTFNADLADHEDIARIHFSQTRYWVYDSRSHSFGPSKFVAFSGMNFNDYRIASSGDWNGVPFDGGYTRNRIERVFGGTYQPNESLRAELLRWAVDLGFVDAENRQVAEKWRFIEVPIDRPTTQILNKPLTRYASFTRCEVRDIFAPDAPCQPQRGAWGLHGIIGLPGRPGDFVFFVTFGQAQAGHEFDESVTKEGVLSWQSQPSQDLNNKRILQFISHDELRNSIYLFLRPTRDLPYTYLGRLKYLDHDSSRERPVYFRWQILDWDSSKVPLEDIGLELAESGSPEGPSEDVLPGSLLITDPPKPRKRGSSRRSFTATKGTNYSGNDARNKKLGLDGEKLVLRHEKELLIEAGRHDLAESVRHVSQEEGDGAGYDIASFTSDGRTKYIEVKTTSKGAGSQFYISPNELAFASEHPDEYYLVRVYQYNSDSDSGLAYVLEGSLDNQLLLEPTEFRASLAGDHEPSNL